MKESQMTTDNALGEIMEEVLKIVGQTPRSMSEPTPVLCINQSRTVNSVKVDIHVVTQPQTGLLRKLFAKIF